MIKLIWAMMGVDMLVFFFFLVCAFNTKTDKVEQASIIQAISLIRAYWPDRFSVKQIKQKAGYWLILK